MTTVSIHPIPNEDGGSTYHAFAGDRRGDGRTPGEAVDAVLSQWIGSAASTLVVLHHNRADRFFSEQQRIELDSLMRKLRQAKETGESLSREDQAKLESLVNTELRAAGERAKFMADSLRQ